MQGNISYKERMMCNAELCTHSYLTTLMPCFTVKKKKKKVNKWIKLKFHQFLQHETKTNENKHVQKNLHCFCYNDKGYCLLYFLFNLKTMRKMQQNVLKVSHHHSVTFVIYEWIRYLNSSLPSQLNGTVVKH